MTFVFVRRAGILIALTLAALLMLWGAVQMVIRVSAMHATVADRAATLEAFAERHEAMRSQWEDLVSIAGWPAQEGADIQRLVDLSVPAGMQVDVSAIPSSDGWTEISMSGNAPEADVRELVDALATNLPRAAVLHFRLEQPGPGNRVRFRIVLLLATSGEGI